MFHLRADDALDVELNGKAIDRSKIRRVSLNAKEVGLPGIAFEIAIEDCPAFHGDNALGLTLRTKAERRDVPYMEELDILVQ